jgi:nitrogen fixation/metabolism regulation signal transduction histidine kinase
MKKDNRRRQYWIDPSFQGRYMAQILELGLAVVVVTIVVTLAVAFALISPGFEFGMGWPRIFGIFGTMLALCLVVTGWLGVRISHRLCGPIYRMRQDLAAIRDGKDARPIKLRDGDAYQDLADEINMTVAYLKQQ